MTVAERLGAWLQTQPGKRVPQERFRVGFAEACPELEHSGNFRAQLLAALETLEAAGVLVLPKGASSWDALGKPKLPLAVTLVRAPAAPRQAAESTVWVPELAFATTVRRADTLERLRTVNDYLIQQRDRVRTVVPFRERALEIFGDEKAFEGQIKGGMLYGGLSITALGMCDPEPPLPREDFDAPGKPLLLLENHHTYWSFLQWNRTALAYASIAYGSGNTIRKSSRALVDALARSGASHAEYFGDLDPTGLVIPAAVNKELFELGQPGLRPAVGLYQRLLAEGKRRVLCPEKRQYDGAGLIWLPTELAEEGRSLFEGGHWLPQEGLQLTRCA